MLADWLVIGGGLAGAVLAERIASQLDQNVLVVEKRRHIGGNVFDYFDPNGILIHKYGPHIFHTNLERVTGYLSAFTAWTPYYHRVSAVVDGNHVPVPFNLNSLYATFSHSYAHQVENELVGLFGFGATVSVLKLMNAGSPAVQNFAQYVYDRVFARYTQKQWGMSPREIDPSVTARVPVRVSRDDRYFADRYQFMPTQGYTALIERMLDHPKIKLLLNTDYREVLPSLEFNRMVYTGPVDAFFDYMHGELPYRSLRFELATLDREFALPTASVNFPNDYAFTRQTEMKRLTGQTAAKTVVATEYPMAWVRDRNEPYYPIPSAESRERHERYRAEIAKLNGTVLFVGRLAEYKYYNMDQVVDRALQVFESAVVRGEPVDEEALPVGSG